MLLQYFFYNLGQVFKMVLLRALVSKQRDYGESISLPRDGETLAVAWRRHVFILGGGFFI